MSVSSTQSVEGSKSLTCLFQLSEELLELDFHILSPSVRFDSGECTFQFGSFLDYSLVFPVFSAHMLSLLFIIIYEPQERAISAKQDKLLRPGAGSGANSVGKYATAVHQSETPPANLNKVSSLARRDALRRALMI